MKRIRKQAVLAKIETVYGDDAVPTGAANAMLVTGLDITPIDGGTVSRDLVRPHLGNSEQIPIDSHVSASFDVEIAGSGVAGTVPAWGVLLRACQFVEAVVVGDETVAAAAVAVGVPAGAFTHAVTAGFVGIQPRTVTLACTLGGGSGVAEFHVTAPAAGDLPAHDVADVVMTDEADFALGGGAIIQPTITTPFVAGDTWHIAVTAPRVEYRPTSSDGDSLSLYVNRDGTLHKTTRARGTVSAKIEAGQLPKWHFAFKGLLVDPTATAVPSVQTSAFKKPLAVSKTHTPLFTRHGVASPMSSFSVDMAGDVKYLNRVGREEVGILDRKPKGSVSIEDPGLGTYDFFAATRDVTLGPLSLVHGTGPGKIVQIDAPSVQVSQPKYADADGTQMIAMDLIPLPTDAGDDEILITVK